MNETQRQILEAAVDHRTAETNTGQAVRTAVMNHIEHRLLEEGVVVGYGWDRELRDSDGVPDEWHARVPAVDGTRFRVFFPEDGDGGGAIPELAETVMAAIGATFVGVFDEEPDVAGTYERREKLAAHYVLPDRSPFERTVKRAATQVTEL